MGEESAKLGKYQPKGGWNQPNWENISQSGVGISQTEKISAKAEEKSAKLGKYQPNPSQNQPTLQPNSIPPHQNSSRQQSLHQSLLQHNIRHIRIMLLQLSAFFAKRSCFIMIAIYIHFIRCCNSFIAHLFDC